MLLLSVFHRVCAKSNLPVRCRGRWYRHCESAAWGKKGGRAWKTEYAAKEKNSARDARTNPFAMASSWRNHFGEICVCYRCHTDHVQVASRQHLILPSRNCHINTRLTGILKSVHASKKLRNPQKNVLGNGIISPGFMMKTSTGRAHCRAQPSKHPLRASFPPEISAYAVAAIKCFKNTAWTINRASRQSTDQQISWKHSIKYHSAFKL